MDKVKPSTLGVIVGNRGFFPDHLCDTGRQTILKVLAEEGIRAIALTPEDTKFGTVETLNDAQKLANLFKLHRDEIDGVLVTLPNFGDERAIANTLRWAELNVPVLVQAFPDDPLNMTLADRRDHSVEKCQPVIISVNTASNTPSQPCIPSIRRARASAATCGGL